MTVDRRIEGTVGQAMGNVECPGNLVVEGNILDGREIRAAGSIHVLGVIQAASVQAGADLRVDGGIHGRDKAECRAAGALRARYLIKCRAQSGGDLRVDGEIEGSIVLCGGDMEVGAIAGGHIAAAGSVRCQTLGTHGSKTAVEVGIDAAAESTSAAVLADIKARRKRAENIRKIIDPLLRNQKCLTPQQREKATELLLEAHGIEADVKRILDELRSRFKQHAGRPSQEIQVGKLVSPGVRLRIRDLETSLYNSMDGPLRISIRGEEAARRIVVIDNKGIATELKTYPTSCNAAQVLRHLAAAA